MAVEAVAAEAVAAEAVAAEAVAAEAVAAGTSRAATKAGRNQGNGEHYIVPPPRAATACRCRVPLPRAAIPCQQAGRCEHQVFRVLHRMVSQVLVR